jgi:hypothetical protein
MTSAVSGLMGLSWAKSVTGPKVAQWAWPNRPSGQKSTKMSLNSTDKLYWIAMGHRLKQALTAQSPVDGPSRVFGSLSIRWGSLPVTQRLWSGGRPSRHASAVKARREKKQGWPGSVAWLWVRIRSSRASTSRHPSEANSARLHTACLLRAWRHDAGHSSGPCAGVRLARLQLHA